jgi:hypothetical protein
VPFVPEPSRAGAREVAERPRLDELVAVAVVADRELDRADD